MSMAEGMSDGVPTGMDCWSERSACAALGHCRRNEVSPIHYAVKLKNELFPMVVIVDIPFSSDHRKMLRVQIHTATETVLNNSLRSMGKGIFTITTVGKSSFLKMSKA